VLIDGSPAVTKNVPGERVYFARMDSPIGELEIQAVGGLLTGVNLTRGREPEVGLCPAGGCEPRVVHETVRQLGEYFQGERKVFQLPIRFAGTEFQNKVWRALAEIPFGVTRSYLDVARAIGQEKACRAVGMANNANPVMIVVPCHRVIGASGKMVGFGGGLANKRWLLEHEAGGLF
jgi:methylated-DNA-[protein]-cysteine S-methyltransferase